MSGAHSGEFVQACCSDCSWRSAAVEVLSELNGEWYARRTCAEEYHRHAIEHRHPPDFVTLGSNTPEPQP